MVIIVHFGTCKLFDEAGLLMSLTVLPLLRQAASCCMGLGFIRESEINWKRLRGSCCFLTISEGDTLFYCGDGFRKFDSCPDESGFDLELTYGVT